MTRDIGQETIQLAADFISCDRRNIDQVNEMLSKLSDLLQYHLAAESSRFMHQDDPTPDQPTILDTVNQNGLELLQKQATPWLVSLLSKSPQMSPDQVEEFIDRVSNIMSVLCGKIAHGPADTLFTLQNCGSIKVRETTYTEAAIGFQTWGAGILLAKFIDEGVVVVKDQTVLELGSGTGLAGLVSGMMGAKITYMTDYHPVVLENCFTNVVANNLEDKVKVQNLDWRECLSPEFQELKEEFSMVIAADCIFDFEHSKLVPKVAKKFISKAPDARFHAVITYRIKFKMEVAAFEENMLLEGWEIESSKLIERHTIDFRYTIYKLPSREQ